MKYFAYTGEGSNGNIVDTLISEEELSEEGNMPEDYFLSGTKNITLEGTVTLSGDTSCLAGYYTAG